MARFPRTVKEHWDNVRALRCVVTGHPNPTIHHCHGGSLKDAGYHTGTGLRAVSDALVIPLKADLHTGQDGIDYGIGVRTWELFYGTQMDYLREVSERLDYDLFELHKSWQKEPPPRG